MQPLTLPALLDYMKIFAHAIQEQSLTALYGITDDKAVGTFIEQALNEALLIHFTYETGNAASGIDFPQLNLDLKVTSKRQPQSSCPFRSAEQKVYGLGYHLLILIYDKQDDSRTATTQIRFEQMLFIDASHTADYQTTKGILELLERDANYEDIVAFLEERHLPLDEIGREQLAQRILQDPPQQGYLTISNALQWRLQYGRALTTFVNGIQHLVPIQGGQNL